MYGTNSIQTSLGGKWSFYNDKELNSSGGHDIINFYALNNKISKYVKQKLIEPHGEISKSTIIVRDLYIPLSIINNTSRPKIKEDIEWNSTINLI